MRAGVVVRCERLVWRMQLARTRARGRRAGKSVARRTRLGPELIHGCHQIEDGERCPQGNSR
jgi:hypothetical protein